MHLFIIIYVGLSFIIGLAGMKKKFGFWGYLFGSLLLTPLVGTLLVFASDYKKPS